MTIDRVPLIEGNGGNISYPYGITPEVYLQLVERISLFMRSSKEDGRVINLWMSGDRGLLETAFLFYDIVTFYWLKIMPSFTINTYGSGVLGLPNILIFLTGKKRIITPNTIFNLGYCEKSTGIGFSSEGKEVGSFLEERFGVLLSTISGSNEDFIGMIKKGRVLKPNEILSLGIAHEILQ